MLQDLLDVYHYAPFWIQIIFICIIIFFIALLILIIDIQISGNNDLEYGTVIDKRYEPPYKKPVTRLININGSLLPITSTQHKKETYILTVKGYTDEGKEEEREIPVSQRAYNYYGVGAKIVFVQQV